MPANGSTRSSGSAKTGSQQLKSSRSKPFSACATSRCSTASPGSRKTSAFRVAAADFVSTDDGTGVVHIAPGFGEDDYQLGLREGLPAVCPIDEDCRFTGAVSDFSGRFVKDADSDIIRALRRRGQLFSESTLVHSYPFCWRCESPLIYRAISSWFVGVESFKDAMLRANGQIWWIPGAHQGRALREMAAGEPETGASAATAIGEHRCRSGATTKPGKPSASAASMSSNGSAERTVTDLHKQFVDDIEIPAPSGNGVLKRVPAVLDCWFESGSMPLRAEPLSVREPRVLRAAFPRRLHHRVSRSDARLVLHPHHPRRRPVRQAGVSQLHRHRDAAGRRRPQDEQTAEELPRADGDARPLRGRRAASLPAELPGPEGRGDAPHRDRHQAESARRHQSRSGTPTASSSPTPRSTAGRLPRGATWTRRTCSTGGSSRSCRPSSATSTPRWRPTACTGRCRPWSPSSKSSPTGTSAAAAAASGNRRTTTTRRRRTPLSTACW